jgi:hypothetical protein
MLATPGPAPPSRGGAVRGPAHSVTLPLSASLRFSARCIPTHVLPSSQQPAPPEVDAGGGEGSWEMPPMDPRTESDATSPLAVAAQSYSFVVLPTVTAPACAAAAAHGEEADR